MPANTTRANVCREALMTAHEHFPGNNQGLCPLVALALAVPDRKPLVFLMLNAGTGIAANSRAHGWRAATKQTHQRSARPDRPLRHSLITVCPPCFPGLRHVTASRYSSPANGRERNDVNSATPPPKAQSTRKRSGKRTVRAMNSGERRMVPWRPPMGQRGGLIPFANRH